MDQSERRARLVEDKIRHSNALERAANPEPVEVPPVMVEPRTYGSWSPPPMMAAEYEPVPEPKQPPPLPARTFTDAEISRMIASVQADTDSRIDAAFEARSSLYRARREAMADFVAQVRKELRKEFQEKLGLMRADVNAVAKAHAAAERRVHDRGAEVVDMQQPLEGKRRA